MRVVLASVSVLFWLGCASPDQSARSELVFLGTVTKIQQGETGDLYNRFVVTTRVDHVLKGSFSRRQFQFPIHSPANSGLTVGRQYTIRATRTATGYMVDDLQWLVPAGQNTR